MCDADVRARKNTADGKCMLGVKHGVLKTAPLMQYQKTC